MHIVRAALVAIWRINHGAGQDEFAPSPNMRSLKEIFFVLERGLARAL
jgi:hypothetical protein